jgi:glycosyltransferase involved in cell wall biosynthesis
MDDNEHIGPRKVAWISSGRRLSQYAPALEPLLVGLFGEGIEISLFRPHTQAPLPLAEPAGGVREFARSLLYWLSRKRVDELLGRMGKPKPDLLHALDASVEPSTARLAEELDVPYLVHCHSLREARSLAAKSPRRFAVLADSQPIRKRLLDAKVGSEKTVRLARPGLHAVKTPKQLPGPGERNIAILANGHASKKQDLELMLRAFARLHTERPELLLFILEAGRAESGLRTVARELDVAREVTFISRQPELKVAEILKATDLFLSAPGKAVFDLHPLLAMAGGVPVLLAPAGAEDYLHAGTTGLEFPRGDFDGLLRALRECLQTPAQAHDIARQALEYVRREHGVVDARDRLSSLYFEACGDSTASTKPAAAPAAG